MDKKYFHEERCRAIFERLLNQKRVGERQLPRLRLKKVRPSWLKNHETGFCLELHGYCKELKLAFEYDGIQHHVYPNPFHKSKEDGVQLAINRNLKGSGNIKCHIFILSDAQFNIVNSELESVMY